MQDPDALPNVSLSSARLKTIRFNLARDVPKIQATDDGYASRLLWEIARDLEHAFRSEAHERWLKVMREAGDV